MALGRVTGFEQEQNRLRIHTEKGEVILRFITGSIVNVFIPVESLRQNPRAVVERGESEVELEIVQGDNLIIRTAALEVIVGNPFELTFKNLNGNVINQDYGSDGIMLEAPVGVRKVLDQAEHFYGFGEKAGFLDKAGEEMVMWNSDIPEPHVPSMKALYKSIPFFTGVKAGLAYGIFFDNTYKIYFDMGYSSREYYSFVAEGGNIDYYFIYGPDIKDVVRRYTSLTGRMALPPLWALGYQQSRWGYFPESTVQELARTARERAIPCDVLYLDIDYMDGYRVFTWDKTRFADPQKMIDELRRAGFKIVTIIDPGVKIDPAYRVYQELLANGYYVTDAAGEPFQGKVWPGDCLFPDFTDIRVREWWGEQHLALLEAGVAGIWNDMNEPAVFTEGPQAPDEYKTMPKSNLHKNDGSPATHAEMHNLYGLLMSQATHEGLQKLSDRRPFIVTRAAYAGIQRYAAVWTGDNQSFWDHLGMALPMCLNLGMSGVAFCGTDVGGFGYNCTGELLSRWVQIGAFTPFFRNHSAWGTRQQEPWAFDTQTEEICRKYISLRYQLLPYTYNLFVEAARTGLPVMRPLVLEYPEDAEVYRLYDQFMFGGSLLVAPVITPATEYRHVYLPAGEWMDYWSGQMYCGPQHLLVHAPLDTLPLYVKKGSIIPNYPVMQYVGEKRVEEVLFDLVPGDGEFNWYEDDGETFAYREGQYNLTRLQMQESADMICVRITEVAAGYREGAQRLTLAFRDCAGGRVMVDGREVAAESAEGRLLVAMERGKAAEVLVKR